MLVRATASPSRPATPSTLSSREPVSISALPPPAFSRGSDSGSHQRTNGRTNERSSGAEVLVVHLKRQQLRGPSTTTASETIAPRREVDETGAVAREMEALAFSHVGVSSPTHFCRSFARSCSHLPRPSAHLLAGSPAWLPDRASERASEQSTPHCTAAKPSFRSDAARR